MVSTLMITFFPSGIFVRSTSTLAKANTSADAVRLAIKSATVDLSPAAVNRPIDPTTKYEVALDPSSDCFFVYLELWDISESGR